MRILVTAGPTREYFDSVRFISNPSSGKMGYAISAEAVRRGHQVALVSGPVDLPKPTGVELIPVVSAKEMFDASIAAFKECHAAVMVAAVCDYRPARRVPRKLKKQQRMRSIQLLPTKDILAHIGKAKGNRIVIGFAMEDYDHHLHAEAKLKRKGCDAIVLNGIGNVGSDRAQIQILRADSGWSATQSGTKRQIGSKIVRLVEELAGRSD